MAYVHPGAGALDYFPCRYGTSKLVFRGPRQRLEGPYLAALGGTETYGKFVAEPWPVLLQSGAGQPVVNLGCINAGVDAFLNDPALIEIAARAEGRVLQVMGAQNLSNQLYDVHPRRNDRFLRARPALRSLYPEIDFTEFSFTRHLLRALARRGPNRFAEVAETLRRTWLERMERLLDAIGAPTVLLWIADAPPADGAALSLGTAPLLVDTGMLAALRPRIAGLVTVVAEPDGLVPDGLSLAPLDAAAAACLPRPAAHRAAAEALAPFFAAPA